MLSLLKGKKSPFILKATLSVMEKLEVSHCVAVNSLGSSPLKPACCLAAAPPSEPDQHQHTRAPVCTAKTILFTRSSSFCARARTQSATIVRRDSHTGKTDVFSHDPCFQRRLDRSLKTRERGLENHRQFHACPAVARTHPAHERVGGPTEAVVKHRERASVSHPLKSAW